MRRARVLTGWAHGPRFAGRAVAAALALALVVAGCGGDDDDDDGDGAAGGDGDTVAECEGALTVGSTDFTEQFIVASMYAEVLDAAGCDVEVKQNLGTREVVFPALENGEIDLVAEYVGTLLEFLNEGAGEATSDLDASLAALQGHLEGSGLVALTPSDAQDRNALAVTRATADEFGLTTVSDLADVAGELVMGGPPECPERPLCLLGYQDVYGLEFKEFKPLDAGGPLTFAALEEGDIDVALVFSSQGSLDDDDIVVLEEDMELQPAENLVPVIRSDATSDAIEALLDEVSAALTTDDLKELNRRVDVDKEDPEDVAEAWLTDQGLL